MAGPADSILGTVNLFYNQQNRRFNQELALEQQKLAQQKEARLGQVQEAQLRDYEEISDLRARKEVRDQAGEDRAAETHILDLEQSDLTIGGLRLDNTGKKTANNKSRIELGVYEQALDDRDFMAMGEANRWLDISKQSVAGSSILTDQFWTALESGNKDASQWFQTSVTQGLDLAEGVKVRSIERMEDPSETGADGKPVKRYVINTIDSNGKEGVITETGSSADDSKPAVFSAKKLDSIMSTSIKGNQIARTLDVRSANIGRDVGDSNQQQVEERISVQANESQSQLFNIVNQLPAGDERTAAKRTLSAAISDVHDEGGDEAVLQYTQNLIAEFQGGEQQADSSQQQQPAVPQTEGPVPPGQTAQEPFQSQADTQFSRNIEESNREGNDERMQRNARMAFTNRPTSGTFSDPLLKEISGIIERSEPSYFGSTSSENYKKADTSLGWFKTNSEALAQRFANAPDALHTEITSLGAVGFYEKYKDVDMGNFAPEILDLNSQVTQATGNTPEGSRKAAEDGTYPTPTAEAITAVTTRLRALDLGPNPTVEKLAQKGTAADIPSVTAVLMGMAKTSGERIAILEKMENKQFTGSMSVNPDQARSTALQSQNYQLTLQKYYDDLKTTSQGNVRSALQDVQSFTDSLYNADDPNTANISAKTRGEMNNLILGAKADSGLSAGEKKVYNEALLGASVAYLQSVVMSGDNDSFLGGLAVWRDDPSFAIGDIRNRIRVTGSELMLLNGDGEPVANGTFSYKELNEYVGAKVATFLRDEIKGGKG
jgi:hypothetical protein